MDNIQFDISSQTNQDAADDLEARKKAGWKVTDAGRDPNPNNKNVLLIQIKEPPFGGVPNP